MKTPITYYGGKQKMVRHIIPLIPEHTTYVEPFCGGAAVFFAKDKSPIEVINDTNGELMNFYRVIQTDFENLELEIKSTLHSREAHRQAKVVYDNPDMFTPVKRAWALFVLSSQGFAGKLACGWGYDIQSDKTNKTIFNKRNGFSSELSERLEHCQLECMDALHIIKTYDREDSFFYCDPPYFNSNCGHYDGYSITDFENLLKALSTIKGKFILSSYPSEILNEYIAQNYWQTKSFNSVVSVNIKSGKANTKTEILTANY
jgi:DNA adenine methylase